MGVDDVRRAMAAAEAIEAEAPRPLVRELAPASSFPVDALGPVLAGAALGIHDRVQAPVAICGQSVLAAATLAVQGHVDVELPTGQHRPICCFFVTVAASGERKSSCDNEALWPIRRRELTLREEHDAAMPAYLNDKESWERQRQKVLADKKRDRAAMRDALEALGPAPEPPLQPLLTCGEPTFEGLCKLFGAGRPSLGIFTAEGGQFIGGHGMADDNKLRTATGLSSLWDGEPIRRVRVADGATVMPGRRLAMHLMAQADVAAVLLTDRMLADQGLLSRLLVTAPDSAAGTRLWREPSPEGIAAVKRYGARLLTLLEAKMPMAEGKTNELAPRQMPMSSGARAGWIAFANDIESQIGAGGRFEAIRGLANKLPEHAARLGAVIQLVDDLAAAELTEDSLAAGIALARHYASEALRMFAAGQVGAELQLAQKLLAWMHSCWSEGAISLPDVYQFGPSSIRDKATAAKMVGLLEEHGWLVRLEAGATIAGKRRRDAWRIVHR